MTWNITLHPNDNCAYCHSRFWQIRNNGLSKGWVCPGCRQSSWLLNHPIATRLFHAGRHDELLREALKDPKFFAAWLAGAKS